MKTITIARPSQTRKAPDLPQALAEWNNIPAKIRSALRGLNDDDLDREHTGGGLSIRELAHHIVEANLVAANMIIAALASDGCKYDWTWVMPNKSWMHRIGYDKADVNPAISALRALCRHITVLVSALPGGMARTVRLNDSPGAKRYVITVEGILKQEVAHAAEHLAEIRQIRSARR